MIFKSQKKLVILFAQDEVIPDNAKKTFRKEIEEDFKIKKATLLISGHSDYPDDLLFAIFKDGKLIAHFRLIGFDWAFSVEKDITQFLKGEKSKGLWTLIIMDCAEEDEAKINCF